MVIIIIIVTLFVCLLLDCFYIKHVANSITEMYKEHTADQENAFNHLQLMRLFWRNKFYRKSQRVSITAIKLLHIMDGI